MQCGSYHPSTSFSSLFLHLHNSNKKNNENQVHISNFNDSHYLTVNIQGLVVIASYNSDFYNVSYFCYLTKKFLKKASNEKLV